MKRFLVFAGQSYYAAGGWADFRGDFDDIGEATKCCPLGTEIECRRDDTKDDEEADYAYDIEWRQIVDTQTLKVVHEGSAHSGTPDSRETWKQ